MTIADNAVSVRLLEGLCEELRARVELRLSAESQGTFRRKFLRRLRLVPATAIRAAQIVTVMIGAWCALREI